MFIGSCVSALISVLLVWRVTVTGDLSLEPYTWFFIFLCAMLFAGGYFYEDRYRKEHPEEDFPYLPEE